MTAGLAMYVYGLGVLTTLAAVALRDWWSWREPRADIPRATARKQRAIRADLRGALKRGKAAR